MIRIHISSVVVDDQDKALAFYTDVLGFEKRADIPLGEPPIPSDAGRRHLTGGAQRDVRSARSVRVQKPGRGPEAGPAAA